MQLEPYIYFNGKTEEALTLYKELFRGTVEMMRMSDAPGTEKMPEEHRKKIMHASFVADGVRFMASDGDPTASAAVGEGPISLSLSLSDRKEADRLFAGLSEGGRVQQPMGDQFWGGYFGSCTDRFGIDWMINCQERRG